MHVPRLNWPIWGILLMCNLMDRLAGVYSRPRLSLGGSGENNKKCQEILDMDQEETFLRSKDVAQLLNCGPDEVNALAKHGRLQAEKVGSRWRYRLSDVQKYMRENQKEK